MPNTLLLDDDLDSVELIVAIEQMFAVRISNKEAEATRTVGDIYTLLLAKSSEDLTAEGKCMTSMAPALEVRPETQLSLFVGSNPERFRVRLDKLSGLRSPSASSPVAWCGALLLCLGIAVLFLAAVRTWLFAPAGVLIAVGLGLTLTSRPRLPPDCVTVGDLARRVSSLNYGRLANEGGRVRSDDLWNVLVELLASHSSIAASEIVPETLILASQIKVA